MLINQVWVAELVTVSIDTSIAASLVFGFPCELKTFNQDETEVNQAYCHHKIGYQKKLKH